MDNCKIFHWRKHPLALCLEIFHSFALTLLEIAFIIETMIESSKSGKSIGCSVAINNRLETSRHWWNLRPFFCGGLSAVAGHVNNAWSQIDSSSHASPSSQWLPGLQAGAPLFPSSDWLCLEGSGGDGKSPAPFSHAVLAASAPHCSDLFVCCWHSTLGPLVNFSQGCSGTELSFGYLLSPWTFLKGKSAAQLHSQCSCSIFLCFSFPPKERALWLAVMQWRSLARVTVVGSSSFLMFHTLIQPPSPLFSVFFFFFASFLSHTDVWCWCGKHASRFQWSSLENRGGYRRPLTQGSRWGVRWSWAPSPAPHGVWAWPRHHIIHILKASWTETMEHKESKETYHPRPRPTPSNRVPQTALACQNWNWPE